MPTNIGLFDSELSGFSLQLFFPWCLGIITHSERHSTFLPNKLIVLILGNYTIHISLSLYFTIPLFFNIVSFLFFWANNIVFPRTITLDNLSQCRFVLLNNLIKQGVEFGAKLSSINIEFKTMVNVITLGNTLTFVLSGTNINLRWKTCFLISDSVLFFSMVYSLNHSLCYYPSFNIYVMSILLNIKRCMHQLLLLGLV